MGNTTLQDGTVLCRKCFSLVPKDIRMIAKISWSKWDYAAYAGYVTSDKEEDNRKMFEPTIKYLGFALDPNNHLFKLSDQYIYPAEWICGYNIDYQPTDIRKVLFSEKAIGKLLLELELSKPSLRYTTILSEQVKADGYRDSTGTFIYGTPDKASIRYKSL